MQRADDLIQAYSGFGCALDWEHVVQRHLDRPGLALILNLDAESQSPEESSPQPP